MTEATRKCCGTPREAEHANGCRYSPFDVDGNEKPLTPAQKRRAKSANEEADKQAEDIDKTTTSKDYLPDEREEWFRAPGLQRMKMDFSKGDLDVLNRMNIHIDQVILETFSDCYQILGDIYDIVREPEVNEETGEFRVDVYGNQIWKKHPVTGLHEEHWDRLGYKERENFLFQIVTRIFEWEQRKEALWTNAMFSKAIFTERFAIEYDAPISGTIDDRNAVGNVKAAEDRYFALMQTSVSRRADAIVRTMSNLQLRLKDSMPS